MNTDLEDKQGLQEEEVEADEVDVPSPPLITRKNGAASALTWFAYIGLISGIIVGFAIGDAAGGTADTGVLLEASAPYWSASIVFFAFFRALAEIINLLHNINRKLDKRD